LTIALYRSLLQRAAYRYGGNVKLLEYVNLFSTEDVVQEFVSNTTYYHPEDDNALVVMAFDQFMSKRVRDSKRRRAAAGQIVNSQNKVISNFGGTYRDDDLIEGYIYRHTQSRWGHGAALRDGSYRDKSGRIDYDLMLEDMQKEMCSKDRAFCVYNRNTRRTYQCGNPQAIPIEQMLNAEWE